MSWSKWHDQIMMILCLKVKHFAMSLIVPRREIFNLIFINVKVLFITPVTEVSCLFGLMNK